jgi:hypothetical protein
MTREQLNAGPRELTQQEMELVTGGGGGQNVAEENHISGPNGASGNPKASAGPGYFLSVGAGSPPGAVGAAVHAVQG